MWEVPRKLRKRLIKTFLDIIILAHLNGSLMSGYDIINAINKKFGILLSPGSIYSMLYALERKNLITGTLSETRRIYTLTDKGKEKMENVLNNAQEISEYLTFLFTKSHEKTQTEMHSKTDDELQE